MDAGLIVMGSHAREGIERVVLVSITEHVVWTADVPVIASYACDCDADLIIIGTHGRRGFDRFLLGSVTERVLRMTPSPVLTVQAQK